MVGLRPESSKITGQECWLAWRLLSAMTAQRKMARLPLRLRFLERVASSLNRASRTQWLRISQPPQWPRTNCAKRMGLSEVVLSNAGDPGNWFGKYVAGATGTADSAAAKESYEAGFDLFYGTTLKDVMINRAEKMQEPDSWAKKEWPSEEKSAGKFKRTNEQLLQEIIQQ